MSAILVTLFTSGSSSAAPIELGSLTDPREHGLVGLGGDEAREVQIVQRPHADSVAVFDRANRREQLSLNVVKLHATMAAALRWWLLHPRSCPVKVDACFRQAGAEEWLLGGGLATVRRVERPAGGVTTIFGYELVGGVWAANRNPASAYTNPLLA